MTTFVRFEEYNDNEGETWNFWLQLDGNGEELDKLLNLLVDVEGECLEIGRDLAYIFTTNVEPEQIVDKLVEYAEEGYMPSHSKVTGKFTCPDDLGENADKLYKGGIKDFFS
mgnify:FL=1